MNESSNLFRSQEEVAREAIKHALKALKKRHLLEEGAHAPAFIALSRPIISQVFFFFFSFFWVYTDHDNV